MIQSAKECRDRKIKISAHFPIDNETLFCYTTCHNIVIENKN